MLEKGVVDRAEQRVVNALAEIDASPVSTRMSTFSEPVFPASILSALAVVSGADWPASRLTAPDGRIVIPPGPVVVSEPPPHATSVIAAADSAAPVTQREIICFLFLELSAPDCTNVTGTPIDQTRARAAR